MIIRRLAAMALILFGVLGAIAQESDKAAEAAVKQTQADLRDESKRQQILKNNPEGQQADAKLDSLVMGNSAVKNQMYDLSADLLDVLMKHAGNDPAKLQEALMKIQSNPEAFVKSLPPELRKKFDGIVRQVEADRGMATPKAP